MNTKKQSILILGRTQTGKTSFKAQLYGRLENSEHTEMKLSEMPSDITAIKEACSQLEKGCSVKRTASNTDEETSLLIEMKDESVVEIPWYDYAGEHVDKMLDDRIINKRWKEKVVASNHWMLFIYPGNLKEIDNIYTRPRKIETNVTETPNIDFKLSDTAFFIELLQMLLFIKDKGLSQKITTPVLQIVVSRCDEIGLCKGKNPREELRDRLPLLVDFLESMWDEKSISFIGLSPQEKKLEEDSNDESFIFEGPPAHGYIVLENGEQDKDLTLTISNLLNVNHEN